MNLFIGNNVRFITSWNTDCSCATSFLLTDQVNERGGKELPNVNGVSCSVKPTAYTGI